MFTVVCEESDGRDDRAAVGGIDSSSLIEKIIREGARGMLAEALQSEVDSYIDRFVAGTW